MWLLTHWQKLPSYFWAFAECFPTWHVWVVGDLIFRAGHTLIRANTLQSNNEKINLQIKARSWHLHISFLTGRQVCCWTSCWHRNPQNNILRHAKIYTSEKNSVHSSGQSSSCVRGKSKASSERGQRKKYQISNLEIQPDHEYQTLKTKKDGKQATRKQKAPKLLYSAIVWSSRPVCFSPAGMIRSFPLASFGISCRGGSGGNQLHSARVSGVRACVWHQWAFLEIGTWRFYLQWEVHILFQKLLSVCVGMHMNMACF